MPREGPAGEKDTSASRKAGFMLTEDAEDQSAEPESNVPMMERNT